MTLSGSYLDGENRVSKMKIALSRQTLNMSSNKNVPYFFFSSCWSLSLRLK